MKIYLLGLRDLKLSKVLMFIRNNAIVIEIKSVYKPRHAHEQTYMFLCSRDTKAETKNSFVKKRHYFY